MPDQDNRPDPGPPPEPPRETEQKSASKKTAKKKASSRSKPPNEAAKSSQITTVAQRSDHLRRLLDKHAEEIDNALAGAINTKHFTRVVMTTWQTGSDFMQKADVRSIIACAIQSAQLGLEIDPLLGEFYMIPFKNKAKQIIEVKPIIGYQGLMKLCRRSNDIESFDVRAVYAQDTFKCRLGTECYIEHEPSPISDPGLIIATYAIAYYRDSPRNSFWVCWRRDIDRAKKKSESGSQGKGPWVSDFEAMALKTALRRVCKVLPLADAARKAVKIDELSDDSRTNYIDVLPKDTEETVVPVNPQTLTDLANANRQ